ncbi:hypothetical protein HHK36_004713 [Tetracentron sinense]|uniref:Aminotransferase-like plant mobile domain-containing protein n=1 Tax=Tetracentron sinense TaxID=13715 RepID=A0A834ZJL4_TETSI|nr:hypothetical protein HHK36_004713 [Tetracentron sinense]
MVRPKRAKTRGSSSARPEMDEDYVPPSDVEEQPIEGSRAGASSNRAGATSSRGRRQSGSDPVVSGIPDTPLLRDLGGHISVICRTQERSPITGWRFSWKPVLTFYQRASPSLRDALGRTPLGPFLTIPWIQSDRRLVAALCERWFGETNTFHFPCCELAITPLDFVMLTGIPIFGEVILPLSIIPMDRAAALMGVSPETMAADSGWEAGKVKLSWLASILEVTALFVIDLNSLAFMSVLWVFLLFILGSYFFMTNRSYVETSFLPLMDPIDRFDTFDWGGAIYASILAGLRRVSHGGDVGSRILGSLCPSLKVSDVTSFPRSSRWSTPSSKVTLQPFSDFDDMIQLHCRGVRRFMGRRVAFSYFGVCEYFLGERVLHQSDGEFWIPLAPLPEMTPALARDTFMEGMRTAGVPIHHLVGEVVTHSFYLSWFRGMSIGPIMRPFSTRPGATEVGGKLVEKYFQMRPLLAILEEDNRALIEENARLRSRCATFEDPSVTFAEIPPHQCRPRPDMTLILMRTLHRTFPTLPDTMEHFVHDDSAFVFHTLPNLENHQHYDRKLKRWMDSLDSSEQEAFHKLKLGTVASLFDVKINGHLVEALLGWVKRGFLEKLDGEENYFRCSLKFLIDYFSPRNPGWISTPSFVGPTGSWPQYRFRALALAVVEHVLFPLSFNYIDMQILEVAEQIMTGHSFIPMLLAETFRALDRCVQKRGGFFRGCISLLQIWILEHLKFCNPLATSAFMRQDLIKSHCSFNNIPPFRDSPEMWYDQLIMLAPDMLVWKCSCLHVVEIISGTSGRHHLILIGLRGSSHYFPNRVVRQFGRTQGIPVIEAIKDVVDFGPSSEKLLSHLLVGWKSRVKSTFGDDQESLVTGEYVRWLTDCCLPYVSPPHPCVEKSTSQEVILKLNAELTRLRHKLKGKAALLPIWIESSVPRSPFTGWRFREARSGPSPRGVSFFERMEALGGLRWSLLDHFLGSRVTGRMVVLWREVILPRSIIPMDRAALDGGLAGDHGKQIVDGGGQGEASWLASILEDFAEFPVGEVDRSASFITSSSLKVSDVTSFPRSSRWSTPSSKVTLQPFSDFDDMIQLHCRGVRRFMGRRVAFSYFGVCEYFLGERVLHQSDGEFWIPLAPLPEMTPALARDTFMEGCALPVSLSITWLRPLLAILEEDNRALIEENARLRSRCATFEDPSVTFAEIPPHQCRPRPDMTLILMRTLHRTFPTLPDTMEHFVHDDSAFVFHTLPNLENHQHYDRKLKRWMDSLDSSEQEAFHKLKLGTVASLFDVKINGHLVEALLGWVKRGFLEKLDGEENYFRCSLKFLIDYFSPRNPGWISTPSFVGPTGSWPQYRFRALALAVVEHVLFPLSFNYIDMQILEVAEQIMTGHSFIPMLLAETFRALDRCVQKRGGFFRGCISLLQIWILEHLKFCNPLATSAFMRQDLIKSHCSFNNIPPFRDSPEMWYDQLIMLAPDMLVWKCSCLHVVEIISGTSGRHHLILIGLRGSSHYFPNRVVRQFGRTQGIPVIEAIKDVVDFGPSSEKLLSHLLVGWKSRVKSTFGDDQESLVTGEYVRWLTDCCLPYVSPPHPCVGEKRKEPMNTVLIEDQPNYKELEERITSLLAENAGLKAEVTKMGIEAAVYQDCI